MGKLNALSEGGYDLVMSLPDKHRKSLSKDNTVEGGHALQALPEPKFPGGPQ